MLCDWDIAPAALVLEETGGVVTAPPGDPFVYSGDFVKPGVIATVNPLLAAKIAAELQSVSL